MRGLTRRWMCRLGTAAAALGLLATTPALARRPKPPSTEAEEPACDELKDDKVTELFQPYEDALLRGDQRAAADALLPILEDEAVCAVHGQAWLKLADLFAGFDMAYSALIAYGKGIDADPTIGTDRVKTALDLSDQMGDDQYLGPILADNVGLEVDKETRSRVAYVAARNRVQNGEFGVALGMLMLVQKDSPLFAQAEALRGIVMVQQGRYTDALAPLLTAQALGREQGKGERWENVLTLNVARSFYAAQNWERAVEYFQQVERGSDFWVEAQFERAWAHFRGDDMNGAIATLMAHESPFFRDWYYPEGDLLRTYSLFMMCKFPQAGQEIEAFSARYTPIYEALDGALATLTPEQAWADTVAYKTGEDTPLPPGLYRQFKTDERFAGAIEAVAKADDELGRLQNVASNPFAIQGSVWLQERRDAIVRSEGQRVVDHLTTARDELKEMLASVQLTKLDIMEYETKLLERAAQTGELEFGDRIGQLRKLRNKRGAQVWPFQGEYWADEIGYYEVVARPDCPDSLTPGGR